MNNPLLPQIEKLYNMIEDRELEYLNLINKESDYNTLHTMQTNIKELKKKLQGLEKVFLNACLAKK